MTEAIALIVAFILFLGFLHYFAAAISVRGQQTADRLREFERSLDIDPAENSRSLPSPEGPSDSEPPAGTTSSKRDTGTAADIRSRLDAEMKRRGAFGRGPGR